MSVLVGGARVVTGPGVTTRSYLPGDEAAVARLFSDCFGREGRPDAWRWRFLDNPSGAGVVELAFGGDAPAGHYAVSAVELWCGGRPEMTGLSGTTMTAPAFRGTGLFPRLARRVYERMTEAGMTLAWGFPNGNSHRGFVRDLGWLDVWQVPKLSLDLARLAPAGDRDCIEARGFDDRFDRLWAAARRRYAVIARRDRSQLAWRYAGNPTRRYRVLVLPDGDGIAGYAVLTRRDDELQVVDILTRDDAAGTALVRAAAELGRAEGCVSAGLWLGVHEPVHRELEKLGFVPGGPVTFLCARPLGGGAHPACEFRNWHLTMGDSDVY